MVQKPKQKGEPAKVRKVVIYMTADLAKALKVHAAQCETNVSAFVNALVERELRKGGKEKN